MSKCNKYRLVCAFLAIVAFVLTACDQDKSVLPSEIPQEGQIVISVETEPAQNESNHADSVCLETSLCPIYIPSDLSERMDYMEVSQDDETLLVFYSLYEDIKLEAFRILLSGTSSDKDIGVMEMDNKNLFVSVSVSNYADEDFTDEVVKDTYYTVMSALSTVLDSIQADEHFREKNVVEVAHAEKNFEYWTVTLPKHMEWDETDADDYLISYYGNVNGERIKLYTFCVGEAVLKNELGFYKIDGKWKHITMESYELPSTEGWKDECVTELYTMMATVNDVIQAITSNENFAERIPE